MLFYTALDSGREEYKNKLVGRYVGKSIDTVPTPAFVIDRKIFAENSAKMIKRARDWGVDFRGHLKTHKAAEGVRLQLDTEEGATHAVLVSTIKEAWGVVNDGLVKEGIVKDILYGLPVGKNKIADLADIWDEMAQYGGLVRLLVDHPQQIRFLEEFQQAKPFDKRWSIFVKVDGGNKRAGVPPTSAEMDELLTAIVQSAIVSLHGFYCHAGHSYASTSLSEATSYLSSEVQIVNEAAKFALSKFGEQLKAGGIHSSPLVLAVGSTPTAHASGAEAKKLLQEVLHGKLELHAGNYPLLDLQQQHTTLIESGRIAQQVQATVVSYYKGRGSEGGDEALIDAGAIAFSKDTGPSGGYGDVVGKPWRLSRVSQEHGILTCTNKEGPDAELKIGDRVDIVGQHACLIAAAYPWYYIVDSSVSGGKEVVDIWVPWKGW